MKKYKDNICFMVDTDNCHIEVGQPRTIQVDLMGDKVEKDILTIYIDNLLTVLVDPSAKKIATSKEISYQDLGKPVTIKRKRETKALVVATSRSTRSANIQKEKVDLKSKIVFKRKPKQGEHLVIKSTPTTSKRKKWKQKTLSLKKTKTP